jgi:YbgC/YbaW family acyl-CoA thioester hydrolase
MPAPSIETAEEVMFYDTDCGGVVHNIAYLRFIEKARTKLAAVMGMELREMAATQLFPVVVRTEIDYRRPALLGDHLIVRGALELLQRARFGMQFEIVRPADGERLVLCRQSLALVQMPEGRPQRLPEMWAAQWPDATAPAKS